MASQEQIPSSLPDTQNADILTPSLEATSRRPTVAVWGRLCPLRAGMKGLDMIRDTGYTVGRGMDCDICLTVNELHNKWLHAISKTHFRIYRECISNTNDTVAYLEDTSQNGTFVDQELVGRGKRVIIGHNSQIALAKKSLTVYIFMSTITHEITSELPSKLKQNYVISRKLGSGACGEVRLIFKKDGSKTLAIKIIQKNYFSAGNGNILNNPINIRNEVEILKKLKHPCIIHLEDIYDTPEAMYIILELMEGGELFEKIKSNGKLSESGAKLIFYQVILAVHYLHTQGITHRDLKPENILLKDNSDSPLIKVSDFGMSKFVDTQTMMKTFCGTPMYVAPEVLATQGHGSYTNQVDVWSLGVILYVCLSGMFPFQNQNATLEQQIRNGMYQIRQSHFQHVSQDAINLIRRMMTVDPRRRITVPQVLLHPWLRDTRMRKEVNKLISTNNTENDENNTENDENNMENDENNTENDENNTENDENAPPLNVCYKRPRLRF